jgi:hypothetical protein
MLLYTTCSSIGRASKFSSNLIVPEPIVLFTTHFPKTLVSLTRLSTFLYLPTATTLLPSHTSLTASAPHHHQDLSSTSSNSTTPTFSIHDQPLSSTLLNLHPLFHSRPSFTTVCMLRSPSSIDDRLSPYVLFKPSHVMSFSLTIQSIPKIL